MGVPPGCPRFFDKAEPWPGAKRCFAKNVKGNKAASAVAGKHPVTERMVHAECRKNETVQISAGFGKIGAVLQTKD
jgi:hypothetical protein